MSRSKRASIPWAADEDIEITTPYKAAQDAGLQQRANRIGGTGHL